MSPYIFLVISHTQSKILTTRNHPITLSLNRLIDQSDAALKAKNPMLARQCELARTGPQFTGGKTMSQMRRKMHESSLKKNFNGKGKLDDFDDDEEDDDS